MESRGWGRRAPQSPSSSSFGAPQGNNEIYTYDVVFSPGEARKKNQSPTPIPYKITKNISQTQFDTPTASQHNKKSHESFDSWDFLRKGWDSNPRSVISRTHDFQSCALDQLSHLCIYGLPWAIAAAVDGYNMLLVRERQSVQPEHSVQRLHSIPQSGRFVKGNFQKKSGFSCK